jgi:hypothetical protein
VHVARSECLLQVIFVITVIIIINIIGKTALVEQWPSLEVSARLFLNKIIGFIISLDLADQDQEVLLKVNDIFQV